jgi:hypothetical protein
MMRKRERKSICSARAIIMFLTISYSRPLKLKEEDSDDELNFEYIQWMIKQLHESLDYMDSLNINVSIRIR